MEKTKVQIILEGDVEAPFYATEGAAGMDIKTNIRKPYVLKPLERKLFKTGIRLGIPDGYEVQVRPRSGLALKHGVTVLNAPGTVDSDYTGDVGVILINLSDKEYTIQPNERIAQLVLAKVEKAEFEEVEIIKSTERGEGGFGHTGK